jgi:phosphate/sulfate permease
MFVIASDMLDTGKNFYPTTEEIFSYLQVFTTHIISFAHSIGGAKNNITHLSAVLASYRDGKVSFKVEV